MGFLRTIAFRLFLLIALVVTGAFVVLTIVSVSVQDDHLMDNVLASAGRVSDVIARSTRYSMLLNRKEDVHQIIASIGGESGIEGIRIYNKQGQVIFGTNPQDIHTVVDMNAEACVMCHAPGGLSIPRDGDHNLSRIFTDVSGNRVLGLITPIRNEAQCSSAACHAHSASQTVLGVLDVKMSLAQVDKGLAELQGELLWLSFLAVLVVALISGWFIWSVVHHPVQMLMAGMKSVSDGKLDHRLEVGSKDELGQLAGVFNRMTHDLHRARAEITSWSNTLQERVNEKAAELESVHKQMLHVEKMASLGNLAATVAHEINNPLEGILTFSKLLIKKIRKTSIPETEKEALCADLSLVADEARRSGAIVQNLLVFARQKGGMFQQVNLRNVVDRCILLIGHHAKIHNVRIEVVCPGEVVIECDADQIQQALVALMVNAIEAMAGPAREEGGALTVEVLVDRADQVCVRMRDTGIGMSPEVLAHIFEPFFTTKAEVKGVGLGLAVVYGIVERHRGRIDVQSSPGAGATFTMTLPLKHGRQADPNSAEEGRNSPEVRSPREGVHQ